MDRCVTIQILVKEANMISEHRKEATKLAANLISTIAAAFLISGIVAPFLPDAKGAQPWDIIVRVGTGFLVHMLAQAVLLFGLRDVSSVQGEQNESDNTDVSDRLDFSSGDRSDIDGISGIGEARPPEVARPEKLEIDTANSLPRHNRDS
jgi:hypothetical protein